MANSSYISQFSGRLNKHRASVAHLPPAVNRKHRIARSIDRRMVVPKQENHWMRAMEILTARRSRDGLEPRHVVDVLKMVENCEKRHRFVPDMVREAAFAHNIPVNGELYSTLSLCYLRHRYTVEAYETFEEGQSLLSEEQSRDLLTELLEGASLDGNYELTKAVADKLPKSLGESKWARDRISRAAALEGRWELALASVGRSGGRERDAGTLSPSLFKEESKGHSQRHSLPSQQEQDAESHTDVRSLVALCSAAGMEGNWEVALSTYRQVVDVGFPKEKQFHSAWLPMHQGVLNGFGASGRWKESLAFFGKFRQWMSADPKTLELVFSTLQCSAGAPPEKVVELYRSLDDVSLEDSDEWWMHVSPLGASVVALASARLACGAASENTEAEQLEASWMRALNLARNYLGEFPRNRKLFPVERTFVMALQLASSASPSAAELCQQNFHEWLWSPQVKELRSVGKFYAERRLPILDGTADEGRGQGQAEDSLARRGVLMKPTSLRPGRQHYFGQNEAERQKAAYDQDYATLDAMVRKQSKFEGEDPDQDPRSVPGGYEDMSSGWGHYNIFPKKIFHNAHDVPNPHNGMTKTMVKFGDPRRTWMESSIHGMTRNRKASWHRAGSQPGSN